MKKKWDTVNLLMGKERKAALDDVIIKHFGASDSYTHLCEEFSTTFIKQIVDLKSRIEVTNRNNAINSRIVNSAHLPAIEEDDLEFIIRQMSLS